MSDEQEAVAALARRIDAEFMDVVWGGKAKREQAEREWSESVYPPKPTETWPRLKAVVAGDKIHYVWDYGVFSNLPNT